MADWQIFGTILLALIIASFVYTHWLERQAHDALSKVEEALRDLIAEVYGDTKKLEEVKELFKSVKSEDDLEKAIKELEEKGIHAECIYKGKLNKKGKK